MGVDLEGTLFNPTTGKIERYGEIMLPDDIGLETIDFQGKNFKMKVINKKTNELFDAKEVFEKFGEYPSGDKMDATWNDIVNSAEPLRSLFHIFERGLLMLQGLYKSYQM